MKIMLYISNLQKGGAERVISILANKMSNKNDVIIVNTYKNVPKYNIDNKIKLINLVESINKNVIIKNIKILKRFNNIVRKENPDIIISFLPEPNYRACLVRPFLRKKLIISVRNDPKVEYNNLIKKIIVKKLYSYADGIVFQTADAMKFFPNKIRKKSTIIANPINDEFFKGDNNNKKGKIIVTTGRLTEQKNHILLIDAFSEVVKKHPEYKLKIYGHGNLEQQLKDKINKLNLNNKVLLMGQTDNVKKELEKCEIYVLSSNYEGMPNSLMEAMAVGLSCVSTDCPCGGPGFLIDNYFNGLLVPVNDKESLVNAINTLIENKKLSNTISNNAKIKMKKFSSDHIVQEWNNYIKEIVDD